MLGQRETGLRSVGQVLGRRIVFVMVQSVKKGEGQPDYQWADLRDLQGPTLNEFVEPQVIAVVAGERLWEATQTVIPGEAGEGELGPQPVARVVGMMELGLQQEGCSRTIDSIDAVVAAARKARGAELPRQSGCGQKGGDIVGIGSIGHFNSKSLIAPHESTRRRPGQSAC